MRFATLLLPLSITVLAGCPAPTDPDLDKPCASRKAASITVGTGDSQFEAIGPDGLLVQTGRQGGNHIWMAFSCQGLGPDLVARYGIRENSTGTDVTGTLESVLTLQYDQASDTDQVTGIYGYFELSSSGAITSAEQLVGHDVTLWVDGSDSCHTTALHAEATAKVTGFAN